MLVILMGKSASGKDTLQKQLSADYDIERVVTATTRAMRDGEQDGVDYHFLTDQQFNELIEGGGFVEYTEFNGVKYGSPKSSFDFDKDQCIILEPEGVQNFVKEFGRKNTFVVYMDLSEKIRKMRSEGRGSFTEEKWQERVKNDNERFDEKTIEDLTNYRLDLTGRMQWGESPSRTAKDLIEVLTAYKEGVERNPDEKLTVEWDLDDHRYLALTDEEREAHEKEKDEILPF